jgi:hypothetical protein
MNERIKQLADQALKECDDAKERGIDQYSKRFAELIIRECANITLDYKNHDHYYGWMDHGEEIIRHFGIER